MLREQQENIAREIEDVQAQNSKLSRLVNRSNVKAVEQAEKAKVDAMNKVDEEKQKTFMAKKNCREEIDRINKKTNIKVVCMKRELKFWQIVSVGTVVMGMLIGWML